MKTTSDHSVNANKKVESEGEFDYTPSETIGIRVGCGILYAIICHDEKRRFKRLFIPRNSKFNCDLVLRDGLARTATYQGKRSLKQLIKDLRGDKFSHHCNKYHAGCQAANCQDGISRMLSIWLKRKRRRR
jgi:hypothetical protein